MHLLVFFVTVALCVAVCMGACTIKKRGVSDASKTIIVNKHNELRNKVATGKQAGLPKAASMPNMTWDTAVAKKAQAWADKCEFEHDQPSDRDTERGYTGQNLAFAEDQSSNSDWASIVQLWYDEVSQFDTSTIDNYQFDEETAHFTQVIWANTTKIGCGYITYMDGSNTAHLYGCDYLPGGNVVSQPIYKRVKTNKVSAKTRVSMTI